MVIPSEIGVTVSVYNGTGVELTADVSGRTLQDTRHWGCWCQRQK